MPAHRPVHKPSVIFEHGIARDRTVRHQRAPAHHRIVADAAAVHDCKILDPRIARNRSAVHDRIGPHECSRGHLGLATHPPTAIGVFRVARSRRSVKAGRLPEPIVIALRLAVDNLNHVRITVNAVIELIPQNRLHFGRSRRHRKPQRLVVRFRLDFEIKALPMFHFAITRRTVRAFCHKTHRPARRRIRQLVRRIIAPIVRLALIVIGIVAKTGITVDRLLILHNPAELDSHLPRLVRINTNKVVAETLWRPVTWRNVLIRTHFVNTFSRRIIRARDLVQHRHTRMPAIQVTPAIVRTARLELVIAPGLFVQRLFRRCVFERRVFHRKLPKLIVQLFKRPAINHHHCGKRSLLHTPVFAIANGLHPNAVHLVRALVPAAKFFLEMFQELPVTIAVTRRTVIQIRIIDQVFGAMCVIRIVLVSHPIRMRFGHPARMAVVAKPTRDTLQSMSKFMRSTPIILQRADTNPHARAIFSVQVLHVILTAVKRRHDGIVVNVNIALELFIRTLRERHHPAERINVERINAFKRFEHALGIRRRNRDVVRLTVIRLRLLANFKMFRRLYQRKAVAFALRNPRHVRKRDYSHGTNHLREKFHITPNCSSNSN